MANTGKLTQEERMKLIERLLPIANDAVLKFFPTLEGSYISIWAQRVVNCAECLADTLLKSKTATYGEE